MQLSILFTAALVSATPVSQDLATGPLCGPGNDQCTRQLGGFGDSHFEDDRFNREIGICDPVADPFCHPIHEPIRGQICDPIADPSCRPIRDPFCANLRDPRCRRGRDRF
ncbi:hypothetical protein DSO57_1037616 [Entomophthora muscae]|uniref:Uncharacterized protein n=1 Tax=Entomophthora muscae TaxID=34485 RepID=A0ACC2RDN6_9FUNG|nr:hypothetical protein DSO57_1037616 [Entomophthora muscae]